MFVIVAGRQQGKTTALVDWFFEHPGYRGILVANQSIRRHTLRMLTDKARQLNIPRIDTNWLRPFVQVAERAYFGTELRYTGIREWAIDDAEQVLRVLLGVEVDYVAINATLVPRIMNATTFAETASWKHPNKDSIDGDFTEGEGRELQGHRALPSAEASAGSSIIPRPRRHDGVDV